MINMKVAYFNKVGNIEKAGLVYKYIFSSIDPHFYFTAYIIPRDDSYDLYAIPKTNNFEDSSAVELDNNTNFSMKNIGYGDDVIILIANDDLNGHANYIKIMLSVPERPIAINGESTSVKFMDYIDDVIRPLESIRAYKLMDTIRADVTANLSSIEGYASIDYERAIESFVFALLVNYSLFKDNLPEGMRDSSEFAYELYGKILYGGAYSSDIATVFSDMILFFSKIKELDILMEQIPNHILAILVSKWAKTKNNEFLMKIQQASNKVSIDMEISLNPVTISEETRLFQVLSEIQNFVYISEIMVKIDNSIVASIVLDDIYFENLYRIKDECIVHKEVKSGSKFFRITYGYGDSGCDNFVGMNYEDRKNLIYYGINKADVIIDGKVENAVVYENLSEKINMLNGKLDSSLGITFIFKGV